MRNPTPLRFAPDAASSLAGALWPINLLLAGLCIAYGATAPSVSAYFPIVLGALCAFGAAMLFWRTNLVVWSPILWFLIAVTVYYGLGPLLFVYGDSLIIDYVNAFHYVDENALFRTNILNAVSIALICTAYEIGMRLIRPTRAGDTPANEETDRLSKRLLILVATLGYSAMALTILTRAVLGQDVIMFGILFSVAELAKIALLLAVYRWVMGYKGSLLPMLLITAVELYLSIGTLMKQEVIEVLFMIFLGVFLARPSRKLVIAAIPIVVATYLALVPVFYGARQAWGDSSSSSASIGVAAAVVELGTPSGTETKPQVWWSRLAQPSVQAFAMEEHDRGRRGKTFGFALLTFIPRMIWPDKPLITVGGQFTMLATASDIGGATGPGFFGEAYWNFGWGGVVLMSAVTGFAYAYFTRRNLSRILQRDLRWLPIAYMSLKMGYRPDDWFVATVVGTVPILVAFWFLLYPLTSDLTVGKKSRSRRALVPAPASRA